MTVSVQVFDIGHGQPAAGIGVRLERNDGRTWSLLDTQQTDEGGRIDGWGDGVVCVGALRLVVQSRKFFATLGLSSAQSEVTIEFHKPDVEASHHIPVLLAPFGYATYTGAAS